MLKHQRGASPIGLPSFQPASRDDTARPHSGWRAIMLLAPAIIMTATMLPCLVRAQSDSLALPDDSTAAPPPSNAVEIVAAKDGIDLRADEVRAAIRLSSPSAPPGGTVALTAHFAVAPGWHIYGAPLPPGEDLTPTSLSFGPDLAARQSVKMPPPTPLHFAALGETLPVYQGDFTSSAELQLKPDLKPGPQTITGTLRFQECNDSLCKMPRTVNFTLPLQISG
jgi:DsbC/DsbD-like thiol-disulfide interchange protein